MFKFISMSLISKVYYNYLHKAIYDFLARNVTMYLILPRQLLEKFIYYFRENFSKNQIFLLEVVQILLQFFRRERIPVGRTNLLGSFLYHFMPAVVISLHPPWQKVIELNSLFSILFQSIKNLPGATIINENVYYVILYHLFSYIVKNRHLKAGFEFSLSNWPAS